MSETTGALGVIYEKDVPVPMRDGVVLRANVFRPDAPGSFPGILVRTPYGKAESGQERYVRAGYVVAVQDTRGRYKSEGVWHMLNDDGRDGYDCCEWIGGQSWSNGRIGMSIRCESQPMKSRITTAVGSAQSRPTIIIMPR